ncbi:hypothetical protein H6F42_19935 [Pseudanabaena sp. FACHB-1998]|uniref:hypothetical protein n=1 Tax=Pseudanabaena sp. FACHB-1998 TaxID=2692858 RepID=UPI0016800373|nr:hypothetical protein [Pseudanabaena sp. FACHB-1998]MBD2179197.1 hypothetical protein [Pseudanabaena sp. FACHB-1998]
MSCRILYRNPRKPKKAMRSRRLFGLSGMPPFGGRKSKRRRNAPPLAETKAQ